MPESEYGADLGMLSMFQSDTFDENDLADHGPFGSPGFELSYAMAAITYPIFRSLEIKYFKR